MKGEHQIHNASVALMVLSLLHDKQLVKLEKNHYTVGIRKTSWIGRFEVLHTSDPFIVIDGAHNEEGLLALKETLVNQYPTRKYRFVFAVTKEKDVNRLLAPFSSIDLNILFTGFNFFRAADPEELYNKSDMTKKSWEVDWHKAISSVIKELHADEMLVITGSLYFISDVRKAFKNGELSFKENKHYM
ncbi:putative folylpolyglutamate synthase [Bacillus sp. TS-2]|nr:putative folylpolyglutamate synthase [Bacillus sp. TS-2]